MRSCTRGVAYNRNKTAGCELRRFRGAQPYHDNTQMRMKNPWGGIKSWALGGGKLENYFPLLIAPCRTAARRTRLDELLFVVSMCACHA
jgi:hypothetical protein